MAPRDIDLRMAVTELGDDELERYARHIVLPEIGGAGQTRLKAARVLVIGAGGIGSPVIQYLAAAGVGELTIVDDDWVDLSNLQRQTIFGDADVGRAKANAAMAAAARINPHVRIVARQERLTTDSAAGLVAGHNVVVDGCDNFETRLAVSDAATASHVPLVSAAVGRFDGQLGVFRGWEADKPCYRCFVGQDPETTGINCAEAGVLGALTGVLGSLAALEAVRAITGFGEDAAGKLLLFDALSLRFRTLRLPKDPGCRCAG